MVVKRKISSPQWESNPRTPIIQPIAQCYTDRAITVLTLALNTFYDSSKRITNFGRELK
jgi:hypothetical protein